jgi:hypothetical protein
VTPRLRQCSSREYQCFAAEAGCLKGASVGGMQVLNRSSKVACETAGAGGRKRRDIFELSGTGRICWLPKAVRQNGRWTARPGRLFVTLPLLIMCDVCSRVGVEREVAWWF